MRVKQIVSLGLAAVMALSLSACGSKGGGEGDSVDSGAGLPSIDQINVGEDYQDITASIKVLTDRTDIVDSVYNGVYAKQFMELYPNITVTYEAVTDYSSSLLLRLTTGDWGDVCFIPSSVKKNELPDYFVSFGDFETLDPVYNFLQEKTYDDQVFGIPNGGTTSGIIYNRKVWKEAGITKMPKTPDEFLEDLQKIKDNTDAIPLYTNFAAGWPVGAWDAYVDIVSTGDPDFKYSMPHIKEPFTKRDDMTGPYAVYYIMYEAVARKLIEDDPASTDWESSKGRINSGEIASMVLGSWAVKQCMEAGPNPEDVGYMLFPISVDGRQYAAANGNYAYGINRQTTTDNKLASMVFVKWLIENSSIYDDEASIPARKDGNFPDALSDFKGVELLSNNPPPEGEDDLFDEINTESEVGISSDDYPDCEIIEAALYGSRTLDEIMEEWNQKWSSAQESLGIEVNQ